MITKENIKERQELEQKLKEWDRTHLNPQEIFDQCKPLFDIYDKIATLERDGGYLPFNLPPIEPSFVGITNDGIVFYWREYGEDEHFRVSIEEIFDPSIAEERYIRTKLRLEEEEKERVLRAKEAKIKQYHQLKKELGDLADD